MHQPRRVAVVSPACAASATPRPATSSGGSIGTRSRGASSSCSDPELAQFALTKAPEAPCAAAGTAAPARGPGWPAAGRFRAGTGHIELSAPTTLRRSVLSQGVDSREGASPHTQRALPARGRAAAAVVLLVRVKPMSSLTVSDCEAYRAFVRDPAAGRAVVRAARHARWSRASRVRAIATWWRRRRGRAGRALESQRT